LLLLLLLLQLLLLLLILQRLRLGNIIIATATRVGSGGKEARQILDVAAHALFAGFAAAALAAAAAPASQNSAVASPSVAINVVVAVVVAVVAAVVVAVAGSGVVSNAIGVHLGRGPRDVIRLLVVGLATIAAAAIPLAAIDAVVYASIPDILCLVVLLVANVADVKHLVVVVHCTRILQ